MRSWSTALTLAFIAVMFAVVRPLAARLALARESASRTRGAIAADALSRCCVAALATEAIGIHAIFGAFLLGAVIPHDSPLARTLHQRARGSGDVLLLPAFFAFTGMRTRDRPGVGLASLARSAG